MKSNHFSHVICTSAIYTLGAIITLMTDGATIAQSKSQFNVVAFLTGCQTSQLSVRRVSSQGATGHIGVVYAFTNTSSSTCTLYGYPGFVPLDAKGQPLKGIKVTESERNYMHHAQRQRLTLTPGAQASFEVVYSHIPSDNQLCPKSAKVQITPPNTYQNFSFVEHLSPCREIFVTPVEAGVIQN
ncbi:MAG: DUF4232 domain-containing protein [Rhizonema sp. PD37]|nr:DUF4232 domain-containing protein [Rhizonema sp. PD37]